MDLETSIGICLTIFLILLARSYIKSSLDAYKEQKDRERTDRAARHPILTSAIGGLIAWKVLDIWNRSRCAGDVRDSASNGDDDNGRSVYDDLNSQ